MQVRYLYLPIILYFLILLSQNVSGEQKIITINYPPDKTIREFFDAGISLSVPLSLVDKIHVKAENNIEGDILPDSKFECFNVPLINGLNSITITASKNNKLLEKVTLTIFRRSEIESSYKNPPSDFTKDLFHMNARKECSACHELTPKDADRTPVNIATYSELYFKDNLSYISKTSTCYSCHKKITSYPFVHGPASVWSCLSCHNSESIPKYSVKQPESDVCFGCHTEQKTEWKSKKIIHGPVNIGRCAICHSPHSAPNEYNLVKPIWDLCTSCHDDKKSGQHIVGGMFFKDGHPTKGKPDPVRPGKELSCASCHNPHASDFPNLWALEAQGPFDLCLKCHKYYYK